MKIFLNLILFLIFTMSFSQETEEKTEYQIDLENSIECISATLMLPDSDLLIMIAFVWCYKVGIHLKSSKAYSNKKIWKNG